MSYEEGLRQAYEGEIIGELLYGELARGAVDPCAKAGFAAICAVEGATHRVLKPLADRYTVLPRQEHIQATVARRLAQLAQLSWPQFIAKACAEWPGYIERFEALHTRAPPEDRPALRRLVAHEVALVQFVTSESRSERGSGDHLHILQDYLDALETPDRSTRHTTVAHRS